MPNVDDRSTSCWCIDLSVMADTELDGQSISGQLKSPHSIKWRSFDEFNNCKECSKHSRSRRLRLGI